MSDLWDGTYKGSAVWDETAQALIDLTNLQVGMRVLDVGSAGGGTLFPALERIGETGSIVGIEVEDDWVEWLQKEIARRGIENAENVLMNGQSMSFPDASFDAVIAGMVGLDEDYDFDAGQVIDGAPTISEILRVLRPGHCFYHSSWLWQEDNEWMGELVRRHLPGCDKRGYFPGSTDGYVALLEFAGFENIQVTLFEGHYTFDDPPEWMAGIEHVWEEELEQIKAQPEVLHAFEKDASDLLASRVNAEGKIACTRSAILVAARKPDTV